MRHLAFHFFRIVSTKTGVAPMSTIYLVIVIIVSSASMVIADSNEEIAIVTEHVAGGVYCILGQGGNTGVLSTEHGNVVVDCKYESVSDDLLKAIYAIAAKPVTCVIITHYHADHTGGTRVIAKNADIIMHPNCRNTLNKLYQQVGSGGEFLDSVKLWTTGMSLKEGNESVRLRYFGPAHTTGDLVAVFDSAKVVHTGDLFFNGRPPYMDIKDQPDTENWIHAIEMLCRDYPDYRFIPGHGAVADAHLLLDLAEYLRILRNEVASAIRDGKTKEEAVNTIDLSDYPLFRDPLEQRRRRINANVACVYDELAARIRD